LNIFFLNIPPKADASEIKTQKCKNGFRIGVRNDRAGG